MPVCMIRPLPQTDFKFLRVSGRPSEEILRMLNDNIIGTPGISMVYQHLNVKSKIKLLHHAYFVTLIKNDQILSTCCFCERTIASGTEKHRSFYIRYFSFKEAYRMKQVSNRLLSRRSSIRDEVNLLLTGRAFDVSPVAKFLHYAYVDSRNVRSAKLCDEFGFQRVRNYTTIIFNRINPKSENTLSIVEIPSADEESIRNMLSAFYKEYSMVSFDNLFKGSKYYALKDQEGNILAGVQVTADRWKIRSLPGLTGKIILNTFSHLPVLRKLFNKNYQFVTLEGIYHAPGCEGYLEILFESLLAKYQVNSGITVVDKQSQLYKCLKSLNLGLVDRLNKEVDGNVICKFIGFTDEEIESFKKYPAYISGIDVT